MTVKYSDAVTEALEKAPDSVKKAFFKQVRLCPCRARLRRSGQLASLSIQPGGAAGKMRAVFQHHWDAMSADERMEAINDLASDLDGCVLLEKAKTKWGLNGVNAQEYSETALETGKYLSLSLSAIERLLPHLEQGSDVTTARMKEYPATFRTEIRDLLPKVDEIKDIRNPAVHRSLSEMRKVVNALIRRYGKPSEIHIELARELKSPRPEREKSGIE